MYTNRLRLRMATLLLALGLLAGACSPSTLEFTIGDCINIPGGEEISDYESVDCEEVHDAEVFALPQHPDGEDAPYPGAVALEAFANERCLADFEPYVGTDYDSSAIFYTLLTPSETAWEEAGDRELVCLLVGEPILEGEGEEPAAGEASEVAQDGVDAGQFAFEQLTGS
ncbi:MAG TPA: septum formation family protein, partial [Euzebya sp.]|nr:septum formation family protein [Euzebya sp.]